MKQNYYTIPFELSDVMKKEDCSMISLPQSVANMLHLITITRFGECKHDVEFGCAVWDHDFETITNMQSFKENVKSSLEKALSKYENRLNRVVVDVGIKQFQSVLKKRRVKNRISIEVRGKLVHTNEDFNWREHFFIGPLSYY